MTLNLDAATHRRLSSYSRKRKMTEANAVLALLSKALDTELAVDESVEPATSKPHKTIHVSNRIKALSDVPPTHDDTDYKENLISITENKYA